MNLDTYLQAQAYDEAIDTRDTRVLKLLASFSTQIEKRVDNDIDSIILLSWLENIACLIHDHDYYVKIEDGGYKDNIDTVGAMINVLSVLNEAPSEAWYETYVLFITAVWHMADLKEEAIDTFISGIDRM